MYLRTLSSQLISSLKSYDILTLLGPRQSGKTTLVIGQNEETLAVTSETCAFHNLGFEPVSELQPGEIVLLAKEGIKNKKNS